MDELVAMDYSGNPLRPLTVQSEGNGVMVEDVDLKSWLEGGEIVEFD